MKKNIVGGLVTWALLVLAVSSAHAWQGGQPFSADYTTTSGRTGDKMTGKIYFAPPKMRMDSSARGHDSIMIIDSSTKTSYMLMPQQHMYMEMHVDADSAAARQAPAPPTSFDPKHPCRADATCKKVGNETVNGRACEKWETTDKRGTTTTWIDQKLFYPIKMVMVDGTSQELSNIKESKPDGSLFEIPSGYRKMDMGGMMKGGRPPQ